MELVDRKKIIIVFVLLVFVYGVARGVNFPNIWTYTHYLFPCADVFVKRTALGCFVEVVGVERLYTYKAFVCFCFSMLFVFLLSFARLIVVSVSKGGFAAFPGVLVFCAGLAPVYLSNIPGYFDFLGALVLLLALAIKQFRLKLLVVVLGFLCLVFIHEAIVVIFLPLAVADLLMCAFSSNKELFYKRALFVIVAGFAIIGITWFVANSSISPSVAMGLLALAQEKTHIPLDRGVFDVFSRNIDDNRHLFAWWFGQVTHESGWFEGVAIYILNFILGAFIVSILNFKMLKYMYGSRVVAVIISLAPLSALALLLVAYDVIRWAAWATACSFILYGILCSRGGAVALRGHRKLLAVVLFFALYQVSISIPLLVPREDKPIISSASTYIIEVITGVAEFPPNKPAY